MTVTTERSWHIGDYHPLAWAETAVKAVAFVIAYVAFVHALDRSVHSPSGVRIAELALLGAAELGILVTIVDRVLERELIAVGFVVFNNAAHASMLYALLAIPGPGGLLSIFCALMLGGELIKWRWLHETRPPMRQLSLWRPRRSSSPTRPSTSSRSSSGRRRRERYIAAIRARTSLTVSGALGRCSSSSATIASKSRLQ